MALDTWLSFALLSLLFCLIPGPSVCFTVAYALKEGVPNTLASIAGQLSSNGLYILAASLGLSRLVQDSGGIFAVLKLAGSAYLVYLGLVQWRARPVRLEGAAAGSATSGGAWGGFGRGFVVCATNPKTLLYYAAVLPPFISPARDTNVQLAILSTTGVAAGGLVLCLYALLASKMRSWLISAGRSCIGNRIAGGLMVAAAAYLALGR